MKRSSKVKEAEEEAQRFIRRCIEWRLSCKDKGFDLDSIYSSGTKESGAIRRASLDLTRALANLRRSDAD